jgi:hypothetical protein
LSITPKLILSTDTSRLQQSTFYKDPASVLKMAEMMSGEERRELT